MFSAVLIDEEWYPAANDLKSAEVLEEWLEKLDQALVDTRNGVVGISWPMAVAGIFALAAVQAWLPARWGEFPLASWAPFALTAGLVVAALVIANQRTDVRRELLVVRAGYVRRRHQIAIVQARAQQTSGSESRRPFLHRLLGHASPASTALPSEERQGSPVRS